jgi:hypothetical protein
VPGTGHAGVSLAAPMPDAVAGREHREMTRPARVPQTAPAALGARPGPGFAHADAAPRPGACGSPAHAPWPPRAAAGTTGSAPCGQLAPRLPGALGNASAEGSGSAGVTTSSAAPLPIPPRRVAAAPIPGVHTTAPVAAFGIDSEGAACRLCACRSGDLASVAPVRTFLRRTRAVS